MITRSQTKRSILHDSFADFQAKFPFVNLGWVTSFQTDITTALNFQSDTAVTNQIKVLTEDVEASVDEGLKALDTLNTYAVVAFPDSPAKQRVFGQDTWDKARNDQQKMSKALKLANSFADDAAYKAFLTGVGYTQLEIDALLTIADNIDTKDAIQEKAKAGRPVTTEDRIKVLNIVWKRNQLLSTMAALVYRDDKVKRDLYLLYPSSTGEETTVIVHVTKAGVPQDNLSVQLSNTALVAQTTDSSGNATFVSVNMPEAVDVVVNLDGGGTVTRDNQAILEGEENVVEIGLP